MCNKEKENDKIKIDNMMKKISYVEKCYKCAKQSTHEFLTNEKKQTVVFTCMEHSKDFDRKCETYSSVIFRYELLMCRFYPYQRVLFEEHVQKIINNDLNLKAYSEEKEQYEYEEHKRMLMEQFKQNDNRIS